MGPSAALLTTLSDGSPAAPSRGVAGCGVLGEAGLGVGLGLTMPFLPELRFVKAGLDESDAPEPPAGVAGEPHSRAAEGV